MSHSTITSKTTTAEVTACSALADATDGDMQHKIPESLAQSNTPPGWPTEPRSLRKHRLVFFGDLILLILPVAFLALAATALHFHEKSISENGAMLQRITLLGPTLFPLVFAALGGRSLKDIALWQAERGSTKKVLETLHGSQSVVSAIGLVVSLRSCSILSFATLVLWSLSPLGGQSSLRLLSESNSTLTTERVIYYPDPEASSRLLFSTPATQVNQISAILSTSISSIDTLRNSSVDVWNHPKVPRLRQLERIETEDLRHDWIDTRDERNVYTSLTGLSVIGLQANTVANFSIPYEYMYVDCKLHVRARAREVKAFFEREYSNHMMPSGWPYNPGDRATGTEHSWLFNVSYFGPFSLVSYESTFFLVSRQNKSLASHTTGYVYYGTEDLGLNEALSLYRCTLNDVELEVNIVCNSAICRTEQVRRATQPRRRSVLMPTDDRPSSLIHFASQLQYFLQYFLTMCGMVSPLSTHPIDNYIYGPTDTFGCHPSYFTSDPSSHNWSTIPDSQVSHRLTEVMNTYWEASRWMETTTRTDPYALSSLNKTTGKPFPGLQLNQTIATITKQIPIYKANFLWIWTLIFCSGTLLTLGLINIFALFQTSVPDIFGAVSSLTRENPYVDLPQGGSTLDGAERARLIKGIQVQLGDVREGESVGFIGLKSISKKDVGNKGLEKGRYYL